jgi:heme exporter protein C
MYLWKRALIWDQIARSSAEIGLVFTTLVLVTGSFWGRPIWGTWWTWDARLTSELVLLFLFLGVIGLYRAFEDRRQGARAAAFLAIIGIINVPIVHFSVNWWNTLHQGSTVNVFGKSTMSWDMLWPLLTMTLATKFYYAASLFRRARTDLLSLEGGKDWVRQIAQDEDAR